MNHSLILLLALPFVCFITLLFIPHKKESLISRTTFLFSLLQLICTQAFLIYWLIQGGPTLLSDKWLIMQSGGIEFFLSLAMDLYSAVFLFALTLISFLITTYAKVYLHKEEGYKRFFINLALFNFGYSLILLADSFELLFAGWELIGITSYLLISFYKHRNQPVKNGLKIFSIYRLGDIGLLLGAWIVHLIFHRSVSLSDLPHLTEELVNLPFRWEFAVLSCLIALSAAAKSAQFPFSYWLPKAMEGPTPSSAIFYGALSVHIGVFLLLRLSPILDHFLFARVLIFFIGFITALITSGLVRVQSNIKAQVAYASLTQVGIMFMECALGLYHLALFHFLGNAFLRCYQLLISPSVVAYLIRHHNSVLRGNEKSARLVSRFPKWLESSLYVFAIQDGYLEQLMQNIFWKPLKSLGYAFRFLKRPSVLLTLLFLGALNIYFGFHPDTSPWLAKLGWLFVILGISCLSAGFSERRSSLQAWSLVGVAQLFVVGAVSAFSEFTTTDVIMFLSGVVVFWVIGFFILNSLPTKQIEKHSGLGKTYQDHEMFFLLCCLGVAGFPITPTFLGFDLILHHASKESSWLALFIAFAYILTGLAVIRLFARLFLGPPQPGR